MMGKHRWKGELAKPIRPKVIRPRGLRVTTETAARKANKEMEDLYRRAIEEAWLVKLELLMDHYKITDKTDFRSLALKLALELRIPGFKVASPRPDSNDLEKIRFITWGSKKGRPPKRFDVLSAVEGIKKKHSISTDDEALSHLAGRGEWPRLKTLKNRLAEERRLKRLAEAETRRLSKWISPGRNPGN